MGGQGGKGQNGLQPSLPSRSSLLPTLPADGGKISPPLGPPSIYKKLMSPHSMPKSKHLLNKH